MHYNLDGSARQFEQYGRRIHITSFDFIGKEKASFDRYESIVFQVAFKAYENINGLKFGFVLVAKSGEIVGLTQTIDTVVDAKCGKEYCCKLSLDLPELSADEYYFYVDIFSDDGNGGHWSYDHPNTPVVLEMVDLTPKGLKMADKVPRAHKA